MTKKKFWLGILAITLVFILSAATCFSQSGGGSENIENANAEQEQHPESAVPSVDTTTNTTSDFIMKGTVLQSYIGTSENVTIPDGVTIIGQGAFWRNHERLTSVTIPDSVTRIEAQAFTHCNRLTSLTIPYRVTYIGPENFGNCYKLTSVTLQSSNIFIASYSDGSEEALPYNLKGAYKEGGIGTYTRPNGQSFNWTKQ